MGQMEKGTLTGLEDICFQAIRMGDIVDMFGTAFEVVYERGAFGLVRQDGEVLDWERICDGAYQLSGTYPDFCHNDHFVSLWELAWNFNCEEDRLYMLKRLGDAE